jgi:hypothetical protein
LKSLPVANFPIDFWLFLAIGTSARAIIA